MGKRNKKARKGSKQRITAKQLMNVLQQEGKEKILIVSAPSRLRVPKPIHTLFRTRQMIESPTINTGITTGTGVYNSFINQTGSTVEYGAAAFSLQDLDQVSSLAAVFDQYRIDRVVMQIKTRNTILNMSTQSAVNQTPPSIFIVVDRDDANVLSSLASLRQYDNVQEATAADHLEIDLEPSVTPAMYASSAFSGYGVQRTGVWLDVNSPAIAHYGVKWGITALNVSATDEYYWDLILLLSVIPQCALSTNSPPRL